MELRAVAADNGFSDSTVIIGAMEGLEPAPGSGDVFDQIDAALFEVAGFEGKSGQILTAPVESGVAVVVGLGSDASFETIRSAAGNAARAVKTDDALCLLALIPIDNSTRAVAEGLVLGGYEFRNYKTTENGANSLTKVDVAGADETQLEEALIAAHATNLARDWNNTPALDKAPTDIAAAIEQAASDAPLDIEIWNLERIREEKLGALIGVSAGSDRDPVLMVMTYRPEGASQHLGIVGKGITFDSGGLSLKSPAFMEEMKDDMSGAAAVAGAAIAIARLGVSVNLTAVIPFTDNAVGGDATRPGDVLRPVDGPTIEVLNTDAEGRLILADGLGVVRRYEPDMIVDVATLTGAAKVALGDQIGAVFGSDSDVAAIVLEAASRAGETFWEMPLFTEYRKQLDSNIADIKNITGSRYGGAIAAALFLNEYSGDGDWAHLDIAGPARWRETAGEYVKGGSGFAVRTLVEVARTLAGSV